MARALADEGVAVLNDFAWSPEVVQVFKDGVGQIGWKFRSQVNLPVERQRQTTPARSEECAQDS